MRDEFLGTRRRDHCPGAALSKSLFNILAQPRQSDASQAAYKTEAVVAPCGADDWQCPIACNFACLAKQLPPQCKFMADMYRLKECICGM
jgi:hypothetical protein